MPNFRYVAIAPDRKELRKLVGPAWALHEFLVDKQTHEDGRVNYGKAIGYAWIRAKWADCPPLRSVKRHMARLKAVGLVWTQQLPFGEGMKVRVLQSAKWAPQASQLPLFEQPNLLSITSGKAVGMLRESTSLIGPKVAPQRCQKWHRNEVKNLREETNNSNTVAESRSSPVEDARRVRMRRAFLEQQIVQLQQRAKVKSSC